MNLLKKMVWLKELIRLAFNLFNGNYKADVLNSFSGLDDDNFEIAINALIIRFKGLAND